MWVINPHAIVWARHSDLRLRLLGIVILLYITLYYLNIVVHNFIRLLFNSISSLALEEHGIMTLVSFMKLCGLAFIIVTIGVGIFKKERKLDADEETEGVVAVYKEVYGMLKLPTIRLLVSVT